MFNVFMCMCFIMLFLIFIVLCGIFYNTSCVKEDVDFIYQNLEERD